MNTPRNGPDSASASLCSYQLHINHYCGTITAWISLPTTTCWISMEQKWQMVTKPASASRTQTAMKETQQQDETAASSGLQNTQKSSRPKDTIVAV
ncbi:hypothetical protein AMELA_G00036640 [Ameiurus melas]|uniref:Uncharacterized protein n=1 Tax=Ameiurus melas TaxID=219545 RepID=A0A7J6B8N0_AMEME|nr:hypothetical protein AMELA_G00036640 [Ameiurus melas]